MTWETIERLRHFEIPWLLRFLLQLFYCEQEKLWETVHGDVQSNFVLKNMFQKNRLLLEKSLDVTRYETNKTFLPRSA